MTTLVTVSIPDGVYEGQEFIIEYEGQQLTVVCPGGCGPGSDIDLEVPTGGSSSADAGAPPQQVDVTVPDGCFPGDEFTVDFDGQSFNVTVPDGVSPGDALTVEVPRTETTPPRAPPSAPKAPKPVPPAPAPAPAPAQREKPPASKYLKGLEIPSFKGPRRCVLLP
jgi:hypothetical protein